jgi:Putative MetA-pathway of phenol degradation
MTRLTPSRRHWRVPAVVAAALALSPPAAAHGPIFSKGPHVVFEDGIELSLNIRRQRKSGAGARETKTEFGFQTEYGLTPDWQIGFEVPLVLKTGTAGSATGLGDVTVSTKYRFLRLDSPGAQRTMAVLFGIKTPTGRTPRLGSGSTDILTGLTAGYEARRWYAFADARYRVNTQGAGGLRRGDTLFLDIVGGIRPVLTGYKEPDTVFLIELNWERARRDRLRGAALANSGGWELFLSPGIFWTYRNFAIKGGVQIPIARALNGSQAKSDYRALVTFQVHL